VHGDLESWRIDTVDFENIQGGLNRSSLVAVYVSLTFGDVVGISGGNFVEIAVAIQIDALGLRDRRFPFSLRRPAFLPVIELLLMNGVHLLPRQKKGSKFSGRAILTAAEAARHEAYESSSGPFRTVPLKRYAGVGLPGRHLYPPQARAEPAVAWL
jgi:hypothetical protein